METVDPDGVTTPDVIEAVDEPDPSVVRDALEPVTDGETVTRDAVEVAVSDTSKLLTTAATRIELAGDAYADAAEAASAIADVPSVRGRLDAFRGRLSTVESFVPELRPGFSVPDDVHRRPGVVYRIAVEIRDVVATAQDAIETADDLSKLSDATTAEHLSDLSATLSREVQEFDLASDATVDTATGQATDAIQPTVETQPGTVTAEASRSVAQTDGGTRTEDDQ